MFPNSSFIETIICFAALIDALLVYPPPILYIRRTRRLIITRWNCTVFPHSFSQADIRASTNAPWFTRSTRATVWRDMTATAWRDTRATVRCGYT
jgi:hypothetical protein